MQCQAWYVLDESTFPLVVDNDLCLQKNCRKKFQLNDSSPLVFQLVCMLTSLFNSTNPTHTSAVTKKSRFDRDTSIPEKIL